MQTNHALANIRAAQGRPVAGEEDGDDIPVHHSSDDVIGEKV